MGKKTNPAPLPLEIAFRALIELENLHEDLTLRLKNGRSLVISSEKGKKKVAESLSVALKALRGKVLRDYRNLLTQLEWRRPHVSPVAEAKRRYRARRRAQIVGELEEYFK